MLLFDVKNHVRIAELTIGDILLESSGSIYIYLGRSNKSNICAYEVMQVFLTFDKTVRSPREAVYKMRNEEVMMHYIPEIVSSCTTEKFFDTDNIYYFPQASFTGRKIWKLGNSGRSADYFAKLIAKVILLKGYREDEIPILDKPVEDKRFLPVSSKNLVVGKIYVTGKDSLGTNSEGWRSTYMYCGKTDQKKEVWAFIGELRASDTKSTIIQRINQYTQGGIRNLDILNSHKKVYEPIRCAQVNSWVFEEQANRILCYCKARF